MKKYIIAGVFLLGGAYFVRKLTKKQNVAREPNVKDFQTEQQTLIFGGDKCPISKETIEQQRNIMEAWKKNDSLGFLMGGHRKYTPPQYPFEWDELCTKEQISQFKTSLQDAGKNLIENAKKGLMPPLLSPQATINLAKQFGKGAGAYDPNKDYNIYCGTEMCWKWDGKRWIKDN